MRKWMRYENGRVLEVDQKRLVKRAKAFEDAYQAHKDGYGVEEVYQRYKPLLKRALVGEIVEPVERTPITIAMRERALPREFEKAVMAFAWALESRPAVYGHLDIDTIHHHRDRFIKEEKGQTYILEYFDDVP